MQRLLVDREITEDTEDKRFQFWSLSVEFMGTPKLTNYSMVTL